VPQELANAHWLHMSQGRYVILIPAPQGGQKFSFLLADRRPTLLERRVSKTTLFYGSALLLEHHMFRLHGGVGWLTAARVRDITAPPSWRPACAGRVQGDFSPNDKSAMKTLCQAEIIELPRDSCLVAEAEIYPQRRE
jgi:hypothetical protein